MPTVSSLMSEDIVLIAWFFLAGESISDRGNIMSGVLHVVMLSWLPIEMMLVLAVWYTLIWVLSCSPSSSHMTVGIWWSSITLLWSSIRANL